MTLHRLSAFKSFLDATMLATVGHNPGDLTQPKRPFVSTQSVSSQIHPLTPPPIPPPPPPPPPRSSDTHHSPISDSASGYAAGDVAERQLLSLAQSMSGGLGGKVMGDPNGGKNHVVWVVSDPNLSKQQGPGASERKKKSLGGPLFSPFKRMMSRGDKRRSATEISVRTPIEETSPIPASSKSSSQSLDGQHLLHLVRTNDDLTQQLIAKSNLVVNLEASMTDLTGAMNQMKAEVEEAKLRDTKYAENIRTLQEVVANQKRDAEARYANCKEHHLAELEKLAEQIDSLTAENEAIKNESDAVKNESDALRTESEALKTESEALRADLETSMKHSAEVAEQNENQEQQIQDLQETIDELQEQVNILSTERDSFKKYFATAKVDAAQKCEELREKIVDLLDRQREMTASIRKGLPLGRIAMKRALQKTEQFLEVRAQKQMLQQQDMYIIDLRKVICELAKVMSAKRVGPGYALRRALQRLRMPFDEIAQTKPTPYRWESAEGPTSEESSDTTAEEENQSHDTEDDSASEYAEESDSKWRIQKRKQRTRPREELSSEVSGSDDASGRATARYRRRVVNGRT